MIISLFDILPIVGLGMILVPWYAICFITGSYYMGWVLLIAHLIIMVVRNIIEPKIVGQGVNLPAIVTLLSMFVGARLFGILGLFGLPIAMAILKSLNDEGVIHIYRRKKGSAKTLAAKKSKSDDIAQADEKTHRDKES